MAQPLAQFHGSGLKPAPWTAVATSLQPEERVRTFAVFLLLSFAMSCAGGVIVKQGVSPGATSWPGSPVLSTISNPSSAGTPENFISGGGNTNESQTFTVTGGDFSLQTISIYAGNGTGTGAGTNLLLKLYDLGTSTPANPYTTSIVGGNLLGGGAGLAVSCTNQSTSSILQFDFTDTDQVTLSNGHRYAFELTGAINTSPVSWLRVTSDAYSGGAACRNQSQIAIGGATRDFAMAIYSVLAFETNYPPVPYGITYHIFTRPINGINPDGANPAAGLVSSGGVLCGTTFNGGMQGAGTAFSLNPDASEFNLIRSFASPPDANNPQSEFAIAGNRFLGTSFGGGTNGTGTIFVAQTNGTVSVIRSFAKVSAHNGTNSGGASPGARLAFSGSTVFGTTTAGGTAANGTVFSMNTNGSAFSVLHDFSPLDSGSGTNTDGAVPWGGLTLIGDTLYGTAAAGGDGGNGVVFSLGTNGGGFAVLHSFSPLDALAATNADGAIPFGGLVQAGNAFYGTTSAGGQGGRGTIFSIQTNGLGFAVLHHFPATDPVNGTNADGATPVAALTSTGDFLFGTAPAGGPNGNGTVYSLRTDGSQFTVLHHFTAIDSSNGTNTDGAFPVGGLLLHGNSLYGTTFSGGPGSVGTVFSVPIPASPAVITSIVRNPDESVTLTFLGGPNSTNVIQAADDLTPPVTWLNLSTNVADGAGVWQFTEANATNGMQFYRSYAR